MNGNKNTEGLAQDCSISSVLATEILQYCTMQLICQDIYPTVAAFTNMV